MKEEIVSPIKSVEPFVDAVLTNARRKNKHGEIDLTIDEIIESFEEHVNPLYGMVGEFCIPDVYPSGPANWCIHRSIWVYGKTYSELWNAAISETEKIRKTVGNDWSEEETY